MSNSRFREWMSNRQLAPVQLAEAAVTLSEALGVPVFPCGADKRPCTGHGYKDAVNDPVAIRALFAMPGAALIGMPTGAVSGYDIIDVDVKDGAKGADWLSANSHRLTSTRTSRTRSGGSHWWYRHVDGIRNSASKIAPGVDVRGDGGYAIVPPSAGYTWERDTVAADMPPWLATECLPAPTPALPIQPRTYTPTFHDGGTSYGLAALQDECDNIRHAVQGTKHSALNKAAYAIGGLVSAGEIQESRAFSELSNALGDIRAQCKDYRAAERTLRNSFRDGMGRPRDVPEPPPPPEPEEIHPAAALLAKLQPKTPAPVPVPSDIMNCGGILQLLVDECVRTAIRPQPFLALGAAICAVGALAGRQYRTKTDLRTNIYIAAIAESGGGKDHASEIVRRAIDDAGLDRYLGGETLASGRAVLSSLEHHPSKLFQVDEFGLFLCGVTGKKAAPHKAEIWSELLKLYSRAKGVYRGTEYANKKENPRIDIYEPCTCFYGTTTPSTFWAALEGGAMSDGSLARFLVFISDNNRPDRNRSAGIFKTPANLIQALQSITYGKGGAPAPGNLPTLHSAPMLATKSADPYTVPMSPDAEDFHDAKLEEEDAWARKVEGTPKASIVNRLGENSAKLALISAISRCPENPVINRRDVAWAWAVAEHCTRSLLQDADRFIADTEFEARLNKALNIIRKHGPCTAREMFQRGFKLPERERREVIDALVTNGAVIAVPSEHAGAGRPTIRYTVAAAGSGE